MMRNCKCANFSIPEHLHKNDRDLDIFFGNEETIYRRFPIIDSNKKTTILPDGKLSPSVFSTKRMSVNRSRYSNHPTDVLYNHNDENHYYNSGIAELSVISIAEFKSFHPNYPDSEKYCFRLILKHDPLECIYPHSEIFIFHDGNLLNDLEKPATVRSAIKAYYQKNAIIIKLPI